MPVPGGHSLQLAGPKRAAGAQAVPVCQRPGKNIGDNLHVLVPVGTEALTGLDPVLVDHPEAPEAHVPRVVVAGERERVARVQPAMIEVTAL